MLLSGPFSVWSVCEEWLVQLMQRFERFRPHSLARIRVLAELGLLAAALIWGFNFILVKMAIGHMPPVYYVGLRFLVGAVFLLPFSWGQMKRLDRHGWVIGVGVGVLLFGGFVLQTVGLSSTSPGVSGFLTGLYVIMVPIILGLATGRWPSPMVGVGVVVVVAGFAILSLYGHLTFGWGEIFTLLATIFWAFHILGVAYGSTRLGALAFVQLQLTTCAVLSLAGSFIFEGPALFPGWAATGAVSLDRDHGQSGGLRADGRRPALHPADPRGADHEPGGGLRADLLDHRRLRHAHRQDSSRVCRGVRRNRHWPASAPKRSRSSRPSRPRRRPRDRAGRLPGRASNADLVPRDRRRWQLSAGRPYPARRDERRRSSHPGCTPEDTPAEIRVCQKHGC